MDDKQWTNVINNAVSNLGMCGKVLQNMFDENESAELLEKFENCAKEYCTLDIQHHATLEALTSTQDYYQDKENVLDIPVKKTYDNFHKKLPKPTEKSIMKHSLLLKYKQELGDNEEEEEVTVKDIDIISTNNFVPPTDPISKTTIRNPVRNNECGHVYEKDTIHKIISQKNTRCPYIGCPAKHYIQVKNLIEDDVLKRKIDRYFLNI